MTGHWQAQLYPHPGRWLVSDGLLEVFGTCSIASFADEADARRFAEARNAWEATAPDPHEFGGCGPFPKPDRYEGGRAIFDAGPVGSAEAQQARSEAERGLRAAVEKVYDQLGMSFQDQPWWPELCALARSLERPERRHA